MVFQCRDEGPQRAPVRWIREGGRPLKPGSVDRNGRLEIVGVSVSVIAFTIFMLGRQVVSAKELHLYFTMYLRRFPMPGRTFVRRQDSWGTPVLNCELHCTSMLNVRTDIFN